MSQMEDLLMGDDSSSGDSDDEVIQMGASGTSAVAAVAAKAPSPAPPPAPAPAPAAAPTPPPAPAATPAPSPGKGGKSDQMARLKSLYSSQPRKQHTPPSQPQASSSRTAPSPMVIGVGGPPQQHRQQPRPQQQPPQRAPAPAPSQIRPLVPNRPPQQQQRQQSTPQQSQQIQQAQLQRGSSSQQPHHTSVSRHSSQQQAQKPPQLQQKMSQPGGGPPADPFAPTPLHQIKERHQQKQKLAVEAAKRSSSSRSTAPGHSSVPASSQGAGSSGGQDRAAMEREMRRQKERFLMFTRVLMKYLEQKDPKMHQKAKLIIKDCAERNKRQERGYESVTASMRSRLKQLVGEQYWKRAESYLKHFLEQRAKGGSSDKGSSGSSSSRPGVPGASSASASSHHQQEQARKLQQQQQQKQQQAKSQQQAPQRPTPTGAATTTNVDNLRKEIQTKRQALQSSKSQSSTSSKSGSTTPSGKGKTARRKSGTSPGPSSRKGSTASASAAASAAASATSSTTPSKQQQQPQQQPPPEPEEAPPREFKDLMEMVDHSIDFDFTVAGLLLSGGSASSSSSATKQQEKEFSLSEEQRKLLYGSDSASRATKTKPASSPTSSPSTKASDASSEASAIALKGWGKRNIVSHRVAWARVRLKEQHKALKEQQQHQQNRPPTVADGLLTLPGGPKSRSPSSTTSSATPASPQAASSQTGQTVATVAKWEGEEQAEQDPALTMLSEGCQIYIRGILEKALQCARQRQNLDGIRLWHEQMDAVVKNNNSSGSSSNDSGKDKNSSNKDGSGNKDGGGATKKPALLLRLGCDISRQAAQASGNAAMICKRMEAALERQSEYVPDRARTLDQETLSEATSMSDLAMRPLLAKGVERADYQARRSYEVYGGKHALEPPLGLVPKKAKLELVDFVMGSHLHDEPGHFHRAETSSLSMTF